MFFYHMLEPVICWPINMLTNRLLFAVLVICMAGCDTPKDASKKSVFDNYSFANAKLSESLSLKDDGTFTQTIQADGISYKIDGEWEVDGRKITFRPFYVRFNTESGQDIVPPEKYSLYIGFTGGKNGRIEFDEDNHYYLNKSK
jgi:hypothetical protein